MVKKPILNFNHINKSLTNEEKEKFIGIYKTYHRLDECYRMMYSRKKQRLQVLRIGSKLLLTVGVATCGITLSPLLGIVSTVGLLLTVYAEKANLQRDTEKCKLAYACYEKVLTEIRDYLRGVVYDEVRFLSGITKLDVLITDNCPPIDNMITRITKSMMLDKKFMLPIAGNINYNF